MSIESQQEFNTTTRESSILVRLLASFGITILNESPQDRGRETSITRRERRPVPLWDLDEY
jgi:hypothetical protein